MSLTKLILIPVEREENVLFREGDLEAIVASADFFKLLESRPHIWGFVYGFDSNPYVFSSRIYAAVDSKRLRG